MTGSSTLRNDIPAGIVVFFVAVPLCLGIALASGAPLFAGLIAGMVGGLLVGALSGSPLGVSGPAAGLAVIVAEAIRTLGSFETFLAAVVLAGVFQVLMGWAKAGVLGYFFPSAVIKGMLAGIGLLIILKQIPHAVGWDKDPEGDLARRQIDGETTFSELGKAFEHVSWSAALVAVVGLAILVLWDKVLVPKYRAFRLIQGPLVVVLFGILYQVVAEQMFPSAALSREHLVDVPVPGSWAELGSLFVQPNWGAFDPRTHAAVYMSAATMAIVASLETLLCVEATDKLDPRKRVTPANRELVAQGVGNIVSGAIGGLPITQVIVRSSANIQSGGQTKAAAIVHGFLLAVFALGFPKLLNLIPLAALAAILLTVGCKLAKPSLFLSMYRLGPSQFWPFVITIGGMIATDLLTGVLLGLAVCVLTILHRNYKNSHFLHRDDEDPPGRRHRVRMRLAEDVTFLNRGAILRELAGIPAGSRVILDLSQTFSIDHDVCEILADFESSAPARDIVIEKILPPDGTQGREAMCPN